MELYSTREATEWDVRLDINEVLTVDVIISNIKERIDELSYVLVSGVELPDKYASPDGKAGPPIPSGSTELHVHVCVVLQRPGKRGDVLQLLRGARKLGDEYCAPRTDRFTYAGWVIHHAKPTYKLDGEPGIRFERGDLPMDPFTEDAALKIKGLLSKWGTDELRARFKAYVDIPTTRPVSKNEIQAKIDRKNALVAKVQQEIVDLTFQLMDK